MLFNCKSVVDFDCFVLTNKLQNFFLKLSIDVNNHVKLK